RPPGGAGDDRHAGGVDGDGAADGEVGVVGRHRPAGHDQELVHIGGAGDDGLRAPDDDAVGPAFGDVDVDVGVGLAARPDGAVALGVGHGDAQRQVVVLDVVDVVDEPLVTGGGRAGVLGVGHGRGGGQRVQPVVGEVALGAARLPADEAHRFQLLEEVGGRL